MADEFPIGSEVEITKPGDEYYKGSYCPAKILSRAGKEYLVEYLHRYEHSGDSNLKEMVKADDIRPSYVPAKRKSDYQSDYPVDFFDEGCWWLARPLKRFNDNEYILRKHYSEQEVQCRTDRIRIHREWKKDEKDDKMKFIDADMNLRPIPEGQGSQSHANADEKSTRIFGTQTEGTSGDKSNTVTMAQVDCPSGNESYTATRAETKDTPADELNTSMAQADGTSGEGPNAISSAQADGNYADKSKTIPVAQTDVTSGDQPETVPTTQLAADVGNEAEKVSPDRTEETSGNKPETVSPDRTEETSVNKPEIVSPDRTEETSGNDSGQDTSTDTDELPARNVGSTPPESVVERDFRGKTLHGISTVVRSGQNMWNDL